MMLEASKEKRLARGMPGEKIDKVRDPVGGRIGIVPGREIASAESSLLFSLVL